VGEESEPGGVRGELARRRVRERGVLQVGVNLLDDRVLAMGRVREVSSTAGSVVGRLVVRRIPESARRRR
jgi:hypothetical protein